MHIAVKNKSRVKWDKKQGRMGQKRLLYAYNRFCLFTFGGIL